MMTYEWFEFKTIERTTIESNLITTIESNLSLYKDQRLYPIKDYRKNYDRSLYNPEALTITGVN